MGILRPLLGIYMILAGTMCSEIAGAEAVHTDTIPSALVTTNTKQVYRFHFSGLHAVDATRLAQQLWPVVSKLPPENPLHRTFLDAKDREGFAEDYRSLRNIFLGADIDTIYFLADEYWIESKTLPGTAAIPGDVAARDRLQRHLKAAGHDTWATTISQFRTSAEAPGWLVYTVGNAAKGQPSTAKRTIVEHALKESCRIKSATPFLGSLPALRMSLNETTPLTVVNLERNKLDAILTQLMTALVPSSAQTGRLSDKVVATTVTASVYPFVHVRQVGHFKTAAEATALAEEIKKQVNGAVQKVVDLDSEIGPLLGMFAQSMVVVSTQGNDVHMIMKPPALFDLEQATIRAHGAQDLDWTALPPPGGYHWELVGSVGDGSRRDVFARVQGVRVLGDKTAISPESPSAEKATFRIPIPDSELVLSRDLKGEIKVEVGKKRAKLAKYPALELLDDRGRVAGVLRLDLGSGDPRYDLARSRSVLAMRMADSIKSERDLQKDVDDAENALQKAKLEKLSRADREELDQDLREKYRNLGYQRANSVVLHEFDKQAREAQRDYPAATLVKDGNDSKELETAWAVDREKFPFAGKWLFDYGLLILYQDSDGNVAGVFATKDFYNSAKFEIDRSKPTLGSAILTGRVKGSKLNFTMIDSRGRERTGQLALNSEGTGGTWTMESTTKEQTRGTRANRLAKPPRKATEKDAEDSRGGPIDRVDVAAPDPLWTQKAPVASFAGYWVHATDKQKNILFKSRSNGLLEGASGNAPGAGNLRAAAAGNLLVILEHVNVTILTPSVREATLSSDGQRLTYITPGAARNAKPLELTRDKQE